MPRIVKPTIRVTPKDGELEVTVNINITVDGQATMEEDDSTTFIREKDEEKVDMMIPNFISGAKLNFGKKE